MRDKIKRKKNIKKIIKKKPWGTKSKEKTNNEKGNKKINNKEWIAKQLDDFKINLWNLHKGDSICTFWSLMVGSLLLLFVWCLCSSATGNKSEKNHVGRRDAFKWTEHMDDAFSDALIRQQGPGSNTVKELREKIWKKTTRRIVRKSPRNNFNECIDGVLEIKCGVQSLKQWKGCQHFLLCDTRNV